MDHAAAVANLVEANHILAREEILNSYGHISFRDPENPERFLLSRSRSAEQVSGDDILTFGLDGEPVEPTKQKLYMERYIHSGIYARHPHINSVIHAHTVAVLPFAISDIPFVPVVGSASPIGTKAPVWDIADTFGPQTTLLVTNREMGADLADAFDDGHCVLMRGHGMAVTGGTILDAVRSAIEIRDNATILLSALAAGGTPKPLHPEEIQARNEFTFDSARGWENWIARSR